MLACFDGVDGDGDDGQFPGGMDWGAGDLVVVALLVVVAAATAIVLVLLFLAS